MKYLLTSALLLVLMQSYGQIYWNMTNASPTSGIPSGYTVSDISRGNNNGTTTLIMTTAVSAGDYGGASGGGNATAAAFTGALNTSTSTYFELTLTPPTATNCFITAIQFGNRSTATGPQLVSIRTSLDSYATNIGTVNVNNNSNWALLTFPTLISVNSGFGTPITIRIYGSNGAGMLAINTANWRIDDLQVTISSSVLNGNALTASSGGTKINWNLADKTNLSHFSIEASANGQQYVSLPDNLAGSVTEFNVISNYQYYRVVAHFTTGAKIYSNVVYVLRGEKTLQAWLAGSNLRIKSNQTAITQVNLYTSSGARIMNQQVGLIGNAIISIAIPNVPSGVYLVQLVQNKRKETTTIFVQ